MRIERYEPAKKDIWDKFVDESKNGTFLLKRDYMEYHADRFPDHSYMFYDDDDKLVALLPATKSGKTLSSHKGLTYGGFVLGFRSSGILPLQLFDLLKEELQATGIETLIYKPVPHIYHRQGAEEDLYALFRNNATLAVRNMATVINLREPIPSSRLGKRAVKRQKKSEISVSEVESVKPFWNIIVEDRMSRYNVRPIHTDAELDYLKSRFPANIRFFTATNGSGEMLGGAVIYLDRGVIHLQYAACTRKGKDLYATDIIYHILINEILPNNNYFDFGTSNEDGGRYLNEGMVHHKEEFGGRSIVYDTYELKIR